MDFLLGMVGRSPIEWAAVVCGLANVALIIRRSMWNYPFGIVMVILYAWIFYDVRLYSEALLQIYFLVIQIFGWFWWLAAREESGRVIVARLSARGVVIVAASAVAGVASAGSAMARWTDADLPYWDASVAVLSVIAQLLLARRFLENWPTWILVDLLAIGLYVTKGLAPTAALYCVFLVLASLGFRTWLIAWRQRATIG